LVTGLLLWVRWRNFGQVKAEAGQTLHELLNKPQLMMELMFEDI